MGRWFFLYYTQPSRVLQFQQPFSWAEGFFHRPGYLYIAPQEEGRILHPLIVWNGIIVDGHTRYAQRVAKAPRSRGNPFLPAYAGQKFLPPGIPLGTKLSAEPRTRPCGLAHSQHSISLYVSRPSAHVGWTGLF